MQAGTCIALPAANPATFQYPDHPVHRLHRQQQKWCRLRSLAREERHTQASLLLGVVASPSNISWPAPWTQLTCLAGWPLSNCCLAISTSELLWVVSELRHAVGHGGCSIYLRRPPEHAERSQQSLCGVQGGARAPTPGLQHMPNEPRGPLGVPLRPPLQGSEAMRLVRREVRCGALPKPWQRSWSTPLTTVMLHTVTR